MKNNARAGVSLTEVLLGLLLTCAALIPIFGMISNNARHVSFNQDRAVAQILASQVIERYRCDSFETLPDRFGSFAAGAGSIAHDPLLTELMLNMPENLGRLYGKFHREAAYTELLLGLMGSFHCRVTWQNNQGKQCTYETKTIFRNPKFRHGK